MTAAKVDYRAHYQIAINWGNAKMEQAVLGAWCMQTCFFPSLDHRPTSFPVKTSAMRRGEKGRY